MKTYANAAVAFLFTFLLLPATGCFQDVNPANLKCADDSTCPATHTCVREQGKEYGRCARRDPQATATGGAFTSSSLGGSPSTTTKGSGGTVNGTGGSVVATGGTAASGGANVTTGGTNVTGGILSATGGTANTGGAGGSQTSVDAPVVDPNPNKPLAAGVACKTADQCSDGFCVDGVCCKSRCDGQCESCSQADSMGTCKPVKGSPVAPRTACGGSGTCKGQCDGENGLACAYPTSQTICTAASCSGGKVVTASVCNGAGTCTESTTSTCATSLCDTDGTGRCAGSCTATSCGTGAYCDASGACVPTLGIGKTCLANTQCTSGFCSQDGVCCDTTCDGQCESCKETGSVGTCKVVRGAPVGSRAACSGTGACKGTCNGTNGKACTLPGSSTPCAAATCVNGAVTAAATCDGQGACAKATTTTCPFNLCTSDGKCTGECTPGTKKCDGLVPSTCDANGRWVAGTACTNLCTGGACSGSCVPGSKACNGQVPQVCDAKATWQSSATCANQACIDGACTGVCSPGAKQCTGNGVQTCGSNGTWGAATACTNQACVNGACTGVCSPGAKQCSGNGVQTCGSNGTWGSAAACTNQACANGACTGVCSPGAKQCSGNGVQTCGTNGTWGTATACTGQACVGGACTGVCSPGAKQCSGNGVQTCGSNGTWGNPVTCTGQVCKSGACTGTCTPGSKQCVGNNLQTCTSDGTWGSGVSCGLQMCENGACVTNTCSGSEGEWAGCRGSGCWVCAEKIAGYPRYLQNHPNCTNNTTCAGEYYTCNRACPAPTDADKDISQCGGTAGQWSGCRGSGCSVCAEKLTAYPNYLNNHPGCIKNTTCAGDFYTCNAACPAPTDADR